MRRCAGGPEAAGTSDAPASRAVRRGACPALPATASGQAPRKRASSSSGRWQFQHTAPSPASCRRVRQARARLGLLRQGQTKAGVSLATGWDESFQRPPPPQPAVPHTPTGRAQPGEQNRDPQPQPPWGSVQPLAEPRAAALSMLNYLPGRTVSSAELPCGQPWTAVPLTYVSPH